MLASERSCSQENESYSFRIECCPESRLLLEARRGNQAAFGELCQRHSGSTLRIIKRISGNKEDAEDALQEAMLKAFVNLHQFDGRSRFATWFARIAINAALMILRKERTRRRSTDERDPLEIADSTPGLDMLLTEQEHFASVKRAVSRIRPSLQVAVELRYMRECSIEETALQLGVTVGAAKSRLFHARTQLRKRIAAECRKATDTFRVSGMRLPLP